MVSYWKQSFILSDNRIPALASDTSSYAFAAPANGGAIMVEVELLFRRIFQAEMEARNWHEGDIVMEEAAQPILSISVWTVFFPLVIDR